MDWKFALVLVFSLIVAVFTIQNSGAVNISFLGFEFTQVSQALVILISAASGALIALLFGAIRWVKDKSRLATAKRSIAALETQVKLLQAKLDGELAKNVAQAAPANEMPTANEQPAENDAVPVDSEETKENMQTEDPMPKKKWYQI
jgi:lipopolysaccharide assembly protein A